MTTISNPLTDEATATGPSRVHSTTGAVQTPLSPFDVSITIRRAVNSDKWKHYVVPARGEDGTGTYGLYLEVVNETPGRESHTRYFLVGQNLYASSRPKGATKANWRHKKVASLEEVLLFLDKVLARPSIKLFGRVLLVELEADSVAQIEEGQLPTARFRGQYRIEKDFGKYEFGTYVVDTASVWPEEFGRI